MSKKAYLGMASFPGSVAPIRATETGTRKLAELDNF